jgi:nucleoside-diphosphate-sugar epimerase
MAIALVTGGAGYIGSRLVRQLVNNNLYVRVLDRTPPEMAVNLRPMFSSPLLEYHSLDLGDLAGLLPVFKNVDQVFHFAAPAIPVGDYTVHHHYWLECAAATLNLLQASLEQHVKKVVCASSCAVYGNSVEQPLREDMLPSPLSPYAFSKLVDEYYCLAFARLHHLPVACLPIFNVYGPGQDPAAPMASVVSKFIQDINIRKPLSIDGDGYQVRDFVFIEDVVNAICLAGQSEMSGIINIGSGKPTSIRELINLLFGLIGEPDYGCCFYARKPAGILYSLADITRARAFGFNPVYSLEAGLKVILPKSLSPDKSDIDMFQDNYIQENKYLDI